MAYQVINEFHQVLFESNEIEEAREVAQEMSLELNTTIYLYDTATDETFGVYLPTFRKAA